MRVLKSFAIAFSMYSRIPMPQFDWKEEDMRYVMCFFPFVGAVQGALFLVLCALRRLPALGGLSDVLFGAVATALPFIITGGIHMDGFLDTVDARHSYGDREKKLEILKDPHTGAFAILYGGLYLIIYFALSVQLMGAVNADEVSASGGLLNMIGVSGLLPGSVHRSVWVWRALAAALLPVLSRGLSAASLMWRKSAKREGLAYTFASAALKKTVRIVNTITICVAAACMIVFAPIEGAAVTIFALLTYLYYIKMADREFGGITGDLAGYFLCLCELAGLAVLAVL